LNPGGGNLVIKGRHGLIPAVVTPAVYWPDGSVRWLSVDGVWPSGQKPAARITAVIGHTKRPPCIKNTSITCQYRLLSYFLPAFFQAIEKRSAI
jgi:hypothetical protein